MLKGKKIGFLAAGCSRGHLSTTLAIVEEAWKRLRRLAVSDWSSTVSIDVAACKIDTAAPAAL